LLLAVSAASGSTRETQRQYLSGHDKDDAVPWNFLCTTGAQSGFWTNIPVPSNWELHGFGTLNYKKDSTNAWTERGFYKHAFAVPPNWSGQRVFLVFDGAMTDTSAKLNGESIGPTHQGGFYRFKYEVTKLVKFGATNRLEVTVAKHSADPSVNNAGRLADYWVFGGIYRPVYLEVWTARR
jgi:beta-galactosidase/beta-glucuronidase